MDDEKSIHQIWKTSSIFVVLMEIVACTTDQSCHKRVFLTNNSKQFTQWMNELTFSVVEEFELSIRVPQETRTKSRNLSMSNILN